MLFECPDIEDKPDDNQGVDYHLGGIYQNGLQDFGHSLGGKVIHRLLSSGALSHRMYS